MENDLYFINIADAVRQKANCRGRKVGAILVRDKRILATGYNGTPTGLLNCTDGGCDRCWFPVKGESYDRCVCVHAEENLFLQCAKFGVVAEGGVIYTTLQPCFSCLKHSVQVGIVAVIYLSPWEQTNKEYARLGERTTVKAFTG